MNEWTCTSSGGNYRFYWDLDSGNSSYPRSFNTTYNEMILKYEGAWRTIMRHSTDDFSQSEEISRELNNIMRQIMNEGQFTFSDGDYFVTSIYDMRQYTRNTGDNLPWYKSLPSLSKTRSNIFNLKPEFDNTSLKDIGDFSMRTFKGNNNESSHYAVFMIGNSDLILGSITIEGIPMLIRPVFSMLYEKVGEQCCKDLIKKIFDFTNKVRISYFQQDLGSTDLMKNDILVMMLSKIGEKLGVTNIGNLANTIESIMSDLLDTTDEWRDSNVDISQMSFLFLNQNKMYRRVLKKMVNNRTDAERSAFNRGLSLGSKFFTAFQKAGYIYHLDDGNWEKDVNIIPELCVKSDNVYRLPDEFKSKYFVKKLIFDPMGLGSNFRLKADAKHPNISSSHDICIGSALSSQFRSLLDNRRAFTSEYVAFLLDIEEAIKVINFDSAYWQLTSDFGEGAYKKLIPHNIKSQVTNAARAGGVKRV